MEHLSLEIFDLEGTGSKYAMLPENASITITDTSEIFASGDVWSHSFTLNVRANVHIFGTAGDMHGSRLHEQINKRRARLWVEGVALYLGYLKLDDEVEVDSKGNVDVSFESGQKTFDEMIEGAKANQVPMMSDVRIGVALWRKRKIELNIKLKLSATIIGKDDIDPINVYNDKLVQHAGKEFEIRHTADGEKDIDAVQLYPRMVFPKGKFLNRDAGLTEENINCLNTDNPYDESHPYCNVALCYQKSGYEKVDTNGNVTVDYSSEPEAQRGYEVMPVNRVNSAPNFFVIYWIKALMKHLGIHIEENQMMDVEDMRRLFFVNTNCAYKEPKIIRGSNHDSGFGRYKFGGAVSLIAEQELKQSEDQDKKGIGITSFEAGNPTTSGWGGIYDIHISGQSMSIISVEQLKDSYTEDNNYFHDAFATSECFPNVDISEVIKAIETGFGVRFLFSDSYQRVRIVLLRNVFRNTDIQNIECEIIGNDVKVENCIRGFRMTYGDSDDTHFYYKGFADKLPHKKEIWVDESDKHDYSKWDLNADYSTLIRRVSAFDKTCYVDPKTGDAYGIKIDKDAKRYRDLHPSLFEYAGYMDAEDGDCTGEDETIETIQVGFAPAIMNDVNFEQERDQQPGVDTNQQFALFVDATMRPRRPDLKDLPDDEKQPGVKSYNDADAVYDIDKLYAEDSPAKNMMADGIVKPGEFALASDTNFNKSGVKTTLSTTLSIAYYIENGESFSTGEDWCKVEYPITFGFDGFVSEGYRLYLQDNFLPNDEGVSPIETKDWGLVLGIMRGSGSDAHVEYFDDPDDGEGNDTWEVVAGSNVSAHPDTCDNYGNLWDYDIENGGRTIEAEYLRMAGWQVSGADSEKVAYTYHYLLDTSEGVLDLLVTPITDMGRKTRSYMGPIVMTQSELETYINQLWSQYGWDFTSIDKGEYILSVRKTDGSLAYADGRFSLKLRAEKLNPYFDPKQPESTTNRRYLEISNPNLRGRGLIDQFYKEYSFWIRNARIANRTVRMELAQLLAIDKTKKVTIGDITGYIRKMQYSVNNKTGLGNVTMEIMYI